MSNAATAATVVEEHPRQTIARVLREAGCSDDVAKGYAEMICREFEGEAIYFAARQWAVLEERNQRIRDKARAGLSLSAIAEEFLLSRSQVQRIVAEGR